MPNQTLPTDSRFPLFGPKGPSLDWDPEYIIPVWDPEYIIPVWDPIDFIVPKITDGKSVLDFFTPSLKQLEEKVKQLEARVKTLEEKRHAD